VLDFARCNVTDGDAVSGGVQISDESTFVVPEHVLARKTGDEVVLLNLDSEQYYGLDEVGARFFELIEDGTPFGAAIETLLAEYQVERGTLVADLASVVGDLQRNGLVVDV
jgi:hypothetical protein